MRYSNGPRRMITCAAVLMLLPCAHARTAHPGDVTAWLVSPQDALPAIASGEPAPVLRPGDQVEWLVQVSVDGDNEGLALLSVDLLQDPGNPELFDLTPGEPAPQGAAVLDRPAGFSNPVRHEPHGSGYGGTPRPAAHGFDDLVQIGGALNTFDGSPRCLGPDETICLGQDTAPPRGIGRGESDVLVARGSLTLPETAGAYTFHLAGALANVLTAGGGAREGTVTLAKTSITVLVADPLVDDLPALAPTPSPHNADGRLTVRPAEGAILPYRHVRFWWPAFQVPGGYVLAIVEDDGSADPFAARERVMLHEVAGDEPRHVVTAGLAFGRSYAWAVVGAAQGVRGITAGSPVRRFSIVPLSENLPDMPAETLGAVEPGLTVFNIASRSDPPWGLGLVVDEGGEVVLQVEKDVGRVGFFDLLDDGRVSIMRARQPDEGSGQGVFEETLDGRVLWDDPGGDDFLVHHDARLMPDGSPLLLLHDWHTLPRDGNRPRRGDRIVVLDRHTGEVTWSWRTIDHYDLGDGFRSIGDWTHGNAVFFHEPDNSFYLSSRSFSRVTRIDADTGEIVYNMGFQSFSGDTDFGFGLFSFQHDPRVLPNGNMLIYDNGNQKVPTITRAVEVAFDDPDAPTDARQVWEWRIVDTDGTPIFTRAQGGVERLANGNTLVCAGYASRLFEVDARGDIVWRMETGPGFPDTTTYRARRIDRLVRDRPGDADGDQDLDLHDLAAMQIAHGGGDPTAFPARLSDTDGDGDIDGDDLDALVYGMTAPID